LKRLIEAERKIQSVNTDTHTHTHTHTDVRNDRQLHAQIKLCNCLFFCRRLENL